MILDSVVVTFVWAIRQHDTLWQPVRDEMSELRAAKPSKVSKAAKALKPLKPLKRFRTCAGF